MYDPFANSISVLFNSSWTNASLEADFCSKVLSSTAPIYHVTISPEVGEDHQPVRVDKLLLVPECFWTLEDLTIVSLENVLLTGSRAIAEKADPLLSLPSTVYQISIQHSELSNPTITDSPYSINLDLLVASNPGLKVLYLISLNNAGTIMTSLPANLSTVRVTNNPRLAGTISSSLLSKLSSTLKLDLNFTGNGITGALPSDLLSNFKGPGITLVLKKNKLSGSIPPSFFSEIAFRKPESVFLDFSGNQLSGELPNNIFGQNFFNSRSVSINLDDNQLSGSIPEALLPLNQSNCWSVYLRLKGNRLSGTIPKLYERLSSEYRMETIFLDFGSNMLSGSIDSTAIPPASMKVHSLTLLLNDNKLTGTLPSKLLRSINPYTWSLGLDFSGNRLTGTIDPAIITRAPLDQIWFLNLCLARNMFTGPLDADLVGSGHRAHSFVLDLSHNPLGGEIPSNMFGPYYRPRSPWDLFISLSNCRLTGSLPAWPTNGATSTMVFNVSSNFLTHTLFGLAHLHHLWCCEHFSTSCC